jgi:predicted phage tail protein
MSLHADKINVIEILNPLEPGEQTRTTLDVRPGKSLEDLFPSVLLRSEFVFSVNGKVAEDKSAVFPQAGDTVVMCPVLAGGGGGGGKNVLRLVAMIVVAFVAPYATSALVGIEGAAVLGAAGVSMVTAAITMVGGMVVNSMIPPPKSRDASSGGSKDADTPTYGVDGPKNSSAEGIVVPVVYGKHRFGGNLINAYTVNDGDTQFVHLLFNAGEGPVASLTDVLINDQTPDKFKDTVIETRLGDADQPLIGMFAQQIIPRNIGLELTTDWRYKTTEGEVDQLRYDFVASNGLYAVDEKSTDTRPVTVQIEVQYRKVGAADWKNMDGTANVGGYMEVPQWSQVESIPGLPESLTQYVPTGGEIRQGSVYYGPVGTVYDGIVVGQVASVPRYTDSFEMSGNKRSALRRSFLTPTLEEARYETRVRRNTPAAPTTTSTKQLLVNNIFWADLNEIIHDPVAYKHTALVGVRVRLTDQLNGLPTVTYLHGGKTVRCWNPKTGVWETRGSSNPAWITLDASTNKRYGAGMSMARFNLPTWIEWGAYCDAAGLEFNGFFDTQTNIWDAMEPVFRCGHAGRTNVGTRHSVTIDRPQTPRQMFSVANMISGTFKQNWLPAADRANEIEATFLDKDDSYKQKTVRIVDKVAAASGRPARQVAMNFTGLVSMDEVWRDANILLNHNRLLLQTIEWSSPLEAIACSVGDVVTVQHDMPRWALAGRLEAGSTASQLVLDRPVVMEPGIAYSALLKLSAVRRYSGAVTGRVGLTVMLSGFSGATNVKRAKINGRDIEVRSVVQQGTTYGVILEDAEGIASGQTLELWDTDAMETRTVVNTATQAGQEFTTINLAAPLPQEPEGYAHWMFGQVSRVGKPFTIRSIKGTHEYRRDLTAIEYQEGAFLTTPAPEATNFSDLPLTVRHAEITGVDDEVFLIGTVTKSRVTVEYRGVDDAYASARVYLSRNGAPEELVGEDPAQVTVEASLGDPLVFRVVARDMFQRWAPRSSAPTIAHIAQGRTTAPGDATGLNAVVTNFGWNVTWDEPLDPDVTASELRIGATWETGRRLFRGKANGCSIPFMAAGDNILRLRHCIGGLDGLYSGRDAVRTITVLPPLQPILTGEVESRIIDMGWQDCTRTQPMQGYDIQRGPNSTELVSIGFETGTRYQYSEPKPGKHLYWVTGVDAAGNRGAAGYREFETFLEIAEYMALLEEGLDERLASLYAINDGQDEALVAEIGNRETAITEVKTLITEGDQQVAQQISTIAAKAVGYTRANLLFNGGHEFLTTGWERVGASGALSVVSDAWGTYLALTGASATMGITSGAATGPVLPATPGQWYSLSGDTRFVSPTGSAFLALEFHNASGRLSTTPGAALAAHDFSNEPERRQQRAVEAQAPDGTTFARAVLWWTGFSGNGQIALRQAKIERGRFPVTAYTSEASDIGAVAAIRSEATARSNAVEAEATARNQLVSSVNSQIASVTTEMQTFVNEKVGTVSSKWGIRVDAGNNVAGIQLLNDSKTSSFIILVDKFAVALPTGAGVTYPFIIGTVNGSPTVGINGNLVVDGTILTNALQAEAVTADKIRAKSLTAAQIAAGAITSDLINVGVGSNLVPNATLAERPGTNGKPTNWGTSSNLADPVVFGSNLSSTFTLQGGVTGYIQQQGGSYAGWGFYDRNAQIFSPSFPVTPFARYEYHALLCAHRCDANVVLQFFDYSGNLVFSEGPAVVPRAGGNGIILGDYSRVGAFGTAPWNAATGRLVIIKGATQPSFADSYLFYTHPMVAVATSSQTVFSPWSPSGLGTKITPEGITTPNLAALSATLGDINAGTVTITGDGGGGWGYLRSPGKWLDSTPGWIMAQHPSGEMFVDFTIGGMKFVMHRSPTGDNASMDWGGIAMDNKGNLTVRAINVIDTLNIRGNAVTVPAIAVANNTVDGVGDEGVGALAIGNYSSAGALIYIRLTALGVGSTVESGGGDSGGF